MTWGGPNPNAGATAATVAPGWTTRSDPGPDVEPARAAKGRVLSPFCWRVRCSNGDVLSIRMRPGDALELLREMAADLGVELGGDT